MNMSYRKRKKGDTREELKKLFLLFLVFSFSNNLAPWLNCLYLIECSFRMANTVEKIAWIDRSLAVNELYSHTQLCGELSDAILSERK